MDAGKVDFRQGQVDGWELSSSGMESCSLDLMTTFKEHQISPASNSSRLILELLHKTCVLDLSSQSLLIDAQHSSQVIALEFHFSNSIANFRYASS